VQQSPVQLLGPNPSPTGPQQDGPEQQAAVDLNISDSKKSLGHIKISPTNATPNMAIVEATQEDVHDVSYGQEKSEAAVNIQLKLQASANQEARPAEPASEHQLPADKPASIIPETSKPASTARISP